MLTNKLFRQTKGSNNKDSCQVICAIYLSTLVSNNSGTLPTAMVATLTCCYYFYTGIVW